MSRLRDISGYLSYVLRHGAEDENISIDTNGWVSIDELIAESTEWPNLTQEEIKQVVASDSKSRYELQNGKIRAVSGHTIESVSIKADTAEEPGTLYHGTPKRNKQSILTDGLQPQSRNDVHLTDSVELAVETGKRHTSHTDESVIIFEIDAVNLCEHDEYSLRQPQEEVFVVEEVPVSCISVLKEVE